MNICRDGMEHETASPTIEEIGKFFADYAACLLGCGATCIRIEKNIGRMAETLGVEADMTILPSHILMTVNSKDGLATWSTNHRMHHTGIDYCINTKLSRLSWAMADGKIGFREAVAEAKRIVGEQPAPGWVVLLLASAANTSFCRLFGGDGESMLLVFLATMVGYRLKQVMLAAKVDVRVVFLCSAFCSSVISAGGHLFGWGSTPEVALGTSVLYLIPGIVYINSVNDMLDGHYVCAYSRFMNAAMLTACLSLGLCAGILLLGLSL